TGVPEDEAAAALVRFRWARRAALWLVLGAAAVLGVTAGIEWAAPPRWGLGLAALVVLAALGWRRHSLVEPGRPRRDPLPTPPSTTVRTAVLGIAAVGACAAEGAAAAAVA